eukprot:6198926-Pleurochrysis_carterae.AAC.3
MAFSHRAHFACTGAKIYQMVPASSRSRAVQVCRAYGVTESFAALCTSGMRTALCASAVNSKAACAVALALKSSQTAVCERTRLSMYLLKNAVRRDGTCL